MNLLQLQVLRLTLTITIPLFISATYYQGNSICDELERYFLRHMLSSDQVVKWQVFDCSTYFETRHKQLNQVLLSYSNHTESKRHLCSYYIHNKYNHKRNPLDWESIPIYLNHTWEHVNCDEAIQSTSSIAANLPADVASLLNMNYIPLLSTQLCHTLPIAIAFYQDFRTLPDNLFSWKQYVINPILAIGCRVELYFVLASRAMSIKEFKYEKYLLKNALHETQLFQYVTYISHYNYSDGNLFVHKLNNLRQTHKNICVNPCEALFYKYYMRMRVNKVLMSFINTRGLQYSLVIYARSDILIRSEFWNDVKVSYHDELLLQSIDSIFVPSFDHWNGLNDRVMMLAPYVFRSYSDKLLDILQKRIKSGMDIHGERLHMNVLSKITLSNNITMVRYFQPCYIISRAINCTWTNYGCDACLFKGISNSDLLNITYPKYRVCQIMSFPTISYPCENA
jgi:hypothetical protein